MTATIAVGTDKGLFLVDKNGSGWSVSDPQFLGWRVTAFEQLQSGSFLAGTTSEWFGPAVQRSPDARTWTQVAPGPRFGPDDGAELQQMWRFHETPDAVYLGVAEAGLFRSDDEGLQWHHVSGLRNHPSASIWEPGAGGMCAHSILHHPSDHDRMWVGVSAVGVFRTDNGGDSWELKNSGVEVTGPPEASTGHDIGYCVHALALDPNDPDVLYRQDHRGLYRTDDGADTWLDANDGVPSRFGFPLVMDHSTGNLFAVPQTSDEHRVPVDGRLRIYRSDDGARSWHDSSDGLAAAPGYAGVLRTSMTTDNAGLVAFGTTSGELCISEDSGQSWTAVDATLPRIFCVATATF
ncbi:MAG: WD40/YVTN/BNR-like repeat-containing protein [Acidimicrobiales bacterium]